MPVMAPPAVKLTLSTAVTIAVLWITTSPVAMPVIDDVVFVGAAPAVTEELSSMVMPPPFAVSVTFPP